MPAARGRSSCGWARGRAVRDRQRQPHPGLRFGRIEDPEALDEALKLIPGVVENGLFLDIADAAIIAGPGITVLRDYRLDADAPGAAKG